MLTVLVIDEVRDRSRDICEALIAAGHLVAAVLPDVADLTDRVQALKPDVILIHTDSPSRDTLEHLAALDRDSPKPVLMFAQDDADDTIRNALKAGVAAYMVDGVTPERLQSLMRVAQLHFEQYQELKRERDEATRKLSERVAVERAKGLLMKLRGLDEEAAYAALRKQAMATGKRLPDLARELIESANLLLG